MPPANHDEIQSLNPANSQNVPARWRAGCAFITASQCFERMAFYGLIMNFAYFLNAKPYMWSTYNDTAVILFFDSVVRMFAIFGAWLADAHLDKFKVVMVGYLMYVVFALPIPFMFVDTWNGGSQISVPFFCVPRKAYYNDSDTERSLFEEKCVFPVAVSLVLFGIGASFVKVLVIPLAADQIPRQNNSSTRSFLNWYYFFANTGTLVAYVGLGYVQSNVSAFWGLLVAYIILFMSGLSFIVAKPFLAISPAEGSCVRDIFGVLLSSSGKVCSSICKTKLETRNRTAYQPLGEENEMKVENEVSPLCLNRSKEHNGGEYDSELVEDVKVFLHICLLYVCYIFYYAAYYQVLSLFVVQGLHMRIPKFDKIHSVPVIWLGFFDTAVIILLIPVLDFFIYPWLKERQLMPNIFKRMLIGFILSTFAILVAGFVESERRLIFWGRNNTSLKPRHAINQTIGDTTYFAADMSIFYLVPQCVLLGMGEVFAYVAGLEFAYTYSPARMESLVTALFWFFTGLGALVSSGFIESIKGIFIFSNNKLDINYRLPCKIHGHVTKTFCKETHLDYYYFILAGFQVFGIILFCAVAFGILPKKEGTIKQSEQRRSEPSEEVPDQPRLSGSVTYHRCRFDSDQSFGESDVIHV